MTITHSNSEKVTLMNGCEVQSINYEACILIRDSIVYRHGKAIDILDTDEKVINLWEEYINGEAL